MPDPRAVSRSIDLAHGQDEPGALEEREEDRVPVAVAALDVRGEVPPLDARAVAVVVAREVELRRGERRDGQHSGEHAHFSILRAVDHEPSARPLRRNDLDPDPLRQFQAWFEAAWPPTCPARTRSRWRRRRGRAAVRALRAAEAADESGFVFFSGYESRKGRELDANPRAALCFYWHQLGRQVRVEGTGRASTDRGFRCVLRYAPVRLSALGRCDAAERGGRGQPRARGGGGGAERASGEGAVSRPETWGGYVVLPEDVRVLAAPGGPPPRSLPLPA